MTRKNDGPRVPETPANMADNPSPWGGGGSGGSGDGSDDGGSGNTKGGSPWLPPRGPGGVNNGGGPRRGGGGFDDLLKRGPFGPGMPQLPGNRNLWTLGLVAIGVLWVAFTSVHQLSSREEGVVTRLGSYSRTVGPGISVTLPAPFEVMEKVESRQIQTENIPDGGSQNLVLTGDSNIINLTYSVRWTIKDPEAYLFQLDDPRATIRDAAESAMRATIANFPLETAITSGKSAIEEQVAQRLQRILDSYRSGVRIEGVAVRDASAPTEVAEAFNRVNVARQQSETYTNEARAYAEQVVRNAQGEAAAFDALYEQYRLSPDVTRRRIYYETMEQVLQRADKTVVDSNGVVPYMALPNVQRRQAPAATPAPPASTTPAQGGAQR
jgi:modulator of FtsH protease HflK